MNRTEKERKVMPVGVFGEPWIDRGSPVSLCLQLLLCVSGQTMLVL